jgi:hypothetical protein
MLVHRLNALIRGQRGIALPMALLTMLILSALIIAFSMMAASEPVLANNQLQVAQARAVAESGVQRAIWALNTNAAGITDSFVPAGAPYDNSVAIPVTVNGAQIGVFTVVVIPTPGGGPNEWNITATGWTPTNTGSGPKVKQVIQVTVFKIGLGNLPSPLTVRGDIDVGGTSLIDSTLDTDPKCGGAKKGTLSRDNTTTGGAARVLGADGNVVANQSGGDIVRNVPDAAFNDWTYSNTELDALKALARQNGTYYQGTVLFNSGNKIPKNGIVFVDTVSGQNIDKNGAGTTPTSDFASVAVHGGAEPAASNGIFSGMIIVAGALSIMGNFQMQGVVYVVNDFTYQGTGNGQITGAVMSQNVRDVSATSIDTDTGGNSTIIWNCRYVRSAGGMLPPTFIIEKGSYKEISG